MKKLLFLITFVAMTSLLQIRMFTSAKAKAVNGIILPKTAVDFQIARQIS